LTLHKQEHVGFSSSVLLLGKNIYQPTKQYMDLKEAVCFGWMRSLSSLLLSTQLLSLSFSLSGLLLSPRHLEGREAAGTGC
jgi:hypothetical protein